LLGGLVPANVGTPVLPETGVCGGAGLFDEPAGTAAVGCCSAPAEPAVLALSAPSSAR